jgi:hypothetical protein
MAGLGGYMAKLKIPKVDEIIEVALNNVTRKYGTEDLRELLTRRNFSDVVNELEEEAEKIYRDSEKKAVEEYLKDKGLIGETLAFPVISRIIDNSLIVSIANTRRARAGRTVEEILIRALSALGVRCEGANIKYKGYAPDIIIPSNAAFGSEKHPNLNKVFVLAVKRTLRERWSEDIRIFRFPNSAFILIKPDPDFTPQKAKDMAKGGVRRAYIPDGPYNIYKNDLSELEEQHNVLFKPLSQLPNDLLTFQRQIGIE